MKLTPQDILNQTFASKIKGFAKEEVKAFLLQVAEALESEISDKEDYRTKLEKVKESLQKFEKREEVLRDTLIAAQKFSTEIKTNAQKESDLIVKEAEMKSDEIINQAQNRLKLLRQEIKNLRFKRKEIENDIINMLNSLKELLETYHKEDEEFDKIEYLGK